MTDLPSNSHHSKGSTEKPPRGEKEKITPVVKGEVSRRKKPLGKRFTETFFGGDLHGAVGYVWFEVLVPAAKDTVSDAVSQGIERMIFGEVRAGSRSSRGRSSNYTGYSSRYNGSSRREDPRDEEKRRMSRRARATHNFDEIILPTRAEANEVLDGMYAIISKYDVVTVSELLELCDEVPNFTDDNYGWTDIRGAGVTKIRGGYLLDLPRPELLD